MCAICGWLSAERQPLLPQHLQQLLQTMRHRGPDDTGTFIDESAGIALGHNRLSIIDLTSGGHQPMVNLNNGDALVFNGEIYNFRELRRDLEDHGAEFRSESDSEVLLMAFQQWGAECVHHIRGMFAFALWRPLEKALYLVRDPMGIKPLYYWCPTQGGIVFASEIKAFLCLPGFPGTLDRKALGQFLEFGYSFEPERSIFGEVRRLPPGHILRVTAHQSELARYFQPELQTEHNKNDGDVEEELLETLRLVVRQHLISDVPIGLLLSGGIDSSLLAALAAQTAPLRTISMGFAHSQVDERPHAAAVARHVGSDHEEVLITPDEILGSLAETIPYFDDLFGDWGTVSTRLLYKKCRERGIKAVVVGEGADELFGGYDVFRRSVTRTNVEWWLIQLYRCYAGRRFGSHYRVFRSIMHRYLKLTKGDRFAAIRLFESRNQLPSNYVMKVDKASMSVSVEARVPYLDQRIAEIAYRLPRRSLLYGDSEKQILRQIARRHHLLPEETLTRPKYGASIAMSWMDESTVFRRYAQERILDGGSWTKELGLRNAMRAYFVHNRAGYSFPHPIGIFRNTAWRLLILEMWSDIYRVSPHAS